MSKSPARKNPKTRSANYESSRSNCDYVSIAIAYAEDAIADSKGDTYCEWVRAAARRFIADLRHSQTKNPRFVFSPGQANRACYFIEQLPHVEGTWETENIVLHAAHVFFVVQLFGFRDADGLRRYTMALFCVARKNAKSPLAAAIMLYALCVENEQGAQVLSAATTGQQARIVFNVAKRMVEKEHALAEEFDIEALANAIARYEIGGVFKPINSKASTQDGLNPSHISLDEIHAHKTRDLLDVLRSAAGGRRSPLWLYTTTEGYENAGPWSELRQFAHNVLNRVVEADHFLALYYSLDDERQVGGRKIPPDNDFDETKWIKANPLIEVNPLLMTENRKLAIEAKQMPGALAEFRIKRLNRRSSAANGWTNLYKWRQCAGTFEFEQMKGATCWAAFDLAATTDMAAWRLLWRIEETYYTWGRFWVPAEAVAHRTERKSVNYAGWVQAGLVQQCEGATINFSIIKRDVLHDIRRFNPAMIAYDSWNSSQFVNDLIEEGVESATPNDQRGLIQFIQGPRSYNPAMKLCESAYLNGKLHHSGDPVLTWHMANVIPEFDSNMNIKPSKRRSPDKIDSACALFMCFGCAALQEPVDMAGFFSNPVVV